MIPYVDYHSVVHNLKRQFGQMRHSQDADVQQVAEQMRLRLITFLQIDQTLSVQEVIEQLEIKWRQDGLLDRPRP